MHGFCEGTQRQGVRAPELMMAQPLKNTNLKLAKDKKRRKDRWIG
jgi:hypothetical protein